MTSALIRILLLASMFLQTQTSGCVDRDDDLGHYTCDVTGNIICRDGWTDPITNCTMPQRNCTQSNTCNCTQGLTGLDCTEDIDECLLSNDEDTCVSENTERCENTYGTYICHCKPGFYEKRCHLYVPEVPTAPPSNSSNATALGIVHGSNTQSEERNLLALGLAVGIPISLLPVTVQLLIYRWKHNRKVSVMKRFRLLWDAESGDKSRDNSSRRKSSKNGLSVADQSQLAIPKNLIIGEGQFDEVKLSNMKWQQMIFESDTDEQSQVSSNVVQVEAANEANGPEVGSEVMPEVMVATAEVNPEPAAHESEVKGQLDVEPEVDLDSDTDMEGEVDLASEAKSQTEVEAEIDVEAVAEIDVGPVVGIEVADDAGREAELDEESWFEVDLGDWPAYDITVTDQRSDTESPIETFYSHQMCMPV